RRPGLARAHRAARPPAPSWRSRPAQPTAAPPPTSSSALEPGDRVGRVQRRKAVLGADLVGDALERDRLELRRQLGALAPDVGQRAVGAVPVDVLPELVPAGFPRGVN